MSITGQLALPFTHEPTYHPADFLPDDSNAEALAWLRAPWPAGRLALWGEPGCGKTHLLHLWAAGRGAAILPGPALVSLPLLYPGGIALDDADTAPERPLFHLLNAAAEDGVPVLLAAREPPSRWASVLPDLASRLRAIPAVEIAAPTEALLRNLLALQLAERQIAVAPAVQAWLLLRLPRDAAAVREAAARLDRAALEAGRRVTHAVAARVLSEIA